MKARSWFAVLVLVALLVGGATAATASVVVEARGSGFAAPEPAVEAPPDAVDDLEQPWTARYLAPTTLLLGLVALGGSVLYYGVRIRGRYKVID